MNTGSISKATLAFILLLTLTTACSSLMRISDPPDVVEVEDHNFAFEEPAEFLPDTEVEVAVHPAAGEAPASLETTSSRDGIAASKPVSVEGRSDSSEASSPVREDEREIGRDQQYNLRAGSVDDNEEWDDYLLYRLHFAETLIRVHEIDVTERHILRVLNAQGQPILGARIAIRNEQDQLIAELTTYSDGHANFFPLGQDPNGDRYQVEVEKDDQIVSFTLDRDTREHEVVLEVSPAPDPVRLDVHFLIDATGSMSDEINQLTTNMITISERIHALASRPDVRFGMTTYRDRGDIFVSETLDFTPDIEHFIEELRQVYAAGGGDYPESLNEGLHNAIHLPEWRTDETISLIFLIADAPPHLDYPDDYDYAQEVFEATQLGIKIFPLASSGLDDQGEYIFRQLAQITSAKFLFLTYGADGMPGDETSHHVDDYSVLSLDQLIVRIVEEELANLQKENIYSQ
jgi:hypothetical protein